MLNGSFFRCSCSSLFRQQSLSLMIAFPGFPGSLSGKLCNFLERCQSGIAYLNVVRGGGLRFRLSRLLIHWRGVDHGLGLGCAPNRTNHLDLPGLPLITLSGLLFIGTEA